MTTITTKELVLVCGSRGSRLSEQQKKELAAMLIGKECLEGCCKDSADEDAEEVCERWHIPIHHRPAAPSEKLKRDRALAKECDSVIGYFSGFSFGTLYTMFYAEHYYGKKVTVINMPYQKKEKKVKSN